MRATNAVDARENDRNAIITLTETGYYYRETMRARGARRNIYQKQINLGWRGDRRFIVLCMWYAE